MLQRLEIDLAKVRAGSTSKSPRERRQLGFITLNGNLTINLKPTHPTLLNGKGQFTFRKALLCTHQNFNFLEINKFW